MIAPNTEKRLKILRFWEEHGLKATIAAFEVSRRTLFDWEHRFKAEARGVWPRFHASQTAAKSEVAGLAGHRDPQATDPAPEPRVREA